MRLHVQCLLELIVNLPSNSAHTAHATSLLGHTHLVSAAFFGLTPLLSTISWSCHLGNFRVQLHSFFLSEPPFRDLHLLHMAKCKHHSLLCRQMEPAWDTLSSKVWLCVGVISLYDSIRLCQDFSSHFKRRLFMRMGSQTCGAVGSLVH